MADAGHQLVIKGGRVIDADGRASRRRRDRSRRSRRAPSPNTSTRTTPTRSTRRVVSIAPGLVDLHTHLREPGREEAETVETGSRGRSAGRVHRRGRHAQHRPGAGLGGRGARSARPRQVGAVRRARRGRHHAGSCGRPARADGRDGRPGRSHLHRRRSRRAGRPPDAPSPRVRRRGLGVTLAQHCEVESPVRRWPHARRRMVVASRYPRASRPKPRSSWSCATSRWRASRAAACISNTCPRPAASTSCVTPSSRGHASHRRGFALTTSRSPIRVLRATTRVFKVNPPLRTDDRRRGDQGRAGRRHDRRDRDRPRAARRRRSRKHPFDEAPPRHARSRDRARLALTELDLAPSSGARADVVATRRHRRDRRRPRRPDRGRSRRRTSW